MYGMTVFNAVQCERGTENHQIEGVPNDRVGVICEHCENVSQLLHQKFRVCSWNVSTIRKVKDMRKVDICGLKAVRWRVA